MHEVWGDGVLAALEGLRERVDAGVDPLHGSQRHLAVARTWKELTEALGYPEVAEPESGAPLTAADLSGRTLL